MKKLLFVVLVAAMVAGTAEARRCGRRCAPVCEERVCAPRCEERTTCIAPARIVDCQYTCNKNEGLQPKVCYLVPAPRNIVKHVHVEESVSYSCACKPKCAVNPTQEQLNELENTGAIGEGYTCYND